MVTGGPRPRATQCPRLLAQGVGMTLSPATRLLEEGKASLRPAQTPRRSPHACRVWRGPEWSMHGHATTTGDTPPPWGTRRAFGAVEIVGIPHTSGEEAWKGPRSEVKGFARGQWGGGWWSSSVGCRDPPRWHHVAPPRHLVCPQVQPRLPDRPAPPQPMPVLPPQEVFPRGDEEGR